MTISICLFIKNILEIRALRMCKWKIISLCKPFYLQEYISMYLKSNYLDVFLLFRSIIYLKNMVKAVVRKMIEKMKNLVSHARFEEALLLGEQHLPTEKAEKARLLQLCLVCARNLNQPKSARHYYQCFLAEVNQKRSVEEEVLYLHVQIIYLFYIRQEKTAEHYLEKFLKLLPTLEDKEAALYTYAAMIYYKILYFINEERFLEAIKLYNQIDIQTIGALYNQNPALYLYIHAHLSGAYMQLGKWRTARQLLDEIQTVSVIEEKPYVLTKAKIMSHLLDYLLYDKPLRQDFIEQHYERLQPMDAFEQMLFVRDIKAINRKKQHALLENFLNHHFEAASKE